MRGYFILGTDTGCGKTHVSLALLRDLRRRGIPAVGYKPVCCGDRKEARALREACNPALPLDAVNPVYLRTVAAPMMAAELEGRRISPDGLEQGLRALAAEGEPVVVDSCGCWETPLAEGVTTGTLAVRLGLPVVLVAANRYGAVGQAAMSVKSVRAAGLECAAVVLNSVTEEWDTACVTNAAMIERCTGVPVIAQLISGQDEMDSGALVP